MAVIIIIITIIKLIEKNNYNIGLKVILIAFMIMMVIIIF